MITPNCSATLGNLKYDSHAQEAMVSLCMLPGVNQARLTLPKGVDVQASPGDMSVLELDGGDGSRTVLTGKVRSISRSLAGTEVWMADAGADLGAFRPSATYEKQSARDIIRSLAGDAGADIGTVDLDLPLAAYVADQKRSAAEHIAALASLAGAVAYLDGDNALQAVLRPGGQADLALLYGREIIACNMLNKPAPTATRVMVGSGPAGTPEAPDALRPSSQAIPANAPAPGAAALWKPTPALRTPKAVATASQAMDAAAAAAAGTIRAKAILLPQLRPGMVVELQGMPGEKKGGIAQSVPGVGGLGPGAGSQAASFKGPWLLVRVTHRLRPRMGAVTTFEGVSAAAAGSSSLGGLLSAAAGLF